MLCILFTVGFKTCWQKVLRWKIFRWIGKFSFQFNVCRYESFYIWHTSFWAKNYLIMESFPIIHFQCAPFKGCLFWKAIISSLVVKMPPLWWRESLCVYLVPYCRRLLSYQEMSANLETCLFYEIKMDNQKLNKYIYIFLQWDNVQTLMRCKSFSWSVTIHLIANYWKIMLYFIVLFL